MSQPKIIYKTVRFRRGGTNVTMPTLSDSDDIGTVLTVSTSREAEEAVFEKPISGIGWVDYDAVNQRAREITTVTVGELSEMSRELVNACTVNLTLGGSNYTPNSNITTKGWFQLIEKDDAGVEVNKVSRYCKVDINSSELPQTGYCQAVFVFRTLYTSALNTGTYTAVY